jgi:hypothetical protein
MRLILTRSRVSRHSSLYTYERTVSIFSVRQNKLNTGNEDEENHQKPDETGSYFLFFYLFTIVDCFSMSKSVVYNYTWVLSFRIWLSPSKLSSFTCLSCLSVNCLSLFLTRGSFYLPFSLLSLVVYRLLHPCFVSNLGLSRWMINSTFHNCYPTLSMYRTASRPSHVSPTFDCPTFCLSCLVSMLIALTFLSCVSLHYWLSLVFPYHFVSCPPSIHLFLLLLSTYRLSSILEFM